MTIALKENNLDDIVFQAEGTTNFKNVLLQGAYNGVDQVECCVVSSSGSQLTPWQDAILFPSSKYFTYNFPCSVGVWYKYAARYTNNDSTKVVQTYQFGVGLNILIAGQSNANEMFYYTTPKNIANNYSRFYQCLNSKQGPLEILTALASNAGDGIVSIVNSISSQAATLGYVPVMQLLNCAADSTSVSQYLNDKFGDLAKAFYRCGGDARYAVWIQGEDDIKLQTSYQEYYKSLNEVHRRLLALTGRNTDTFKFIIVLTGAVNYSEATDVSEAAIRQAQIDYANNEAGAIYAGSLLDVKLSSDGMHMERSALGNGAMGVKIATVILNDLKL